LKTSWGTGPSRSSIRLTPVTRSDPWNEKKEAGMRRRGISLGGILVIVGVLIALFWSILLGLIVALIGLIAFGGFVRGKWY
jgi:hypothetical protein